MLYIYRKAASDGARDLAESINVNCRRLNDLRKAHFGAGVRAGDRIVCWGEALPAINGIQILNGAPLINKFEQAQKLKEANVATVEVSAERRMTTRTQPETISTVIHNEEEAQRLIEGLNNLITAFRRPAEEWLPRRFNHIGGHDLLHPGTGDYWVKKLNIKREFRLHIFGGKSIRAGVKVLREGVTPHEWIRSFDAGWRIKYDGFSSTKPMRALAAKAVEALGLDFGAVDLAELADGKLIVLEVNRAPGVEGGTTETYAKAIEGWVRGELAAAA